MSAKRSGDDFAESRAGRLCAAHLAHELARFSDATLTTELRVELAAICDTLAVTPFAKLLPEAEAVVRLLAALRESPSGGAAGRLGEELLLAAVQELATRPETYGDALSRDAWFHLAEDLAEDELIRTTLIHASVNNPVFAMLIAEVLYNGISDFLNESGRVTQMIPGMASLLKAGQSLLGAGFERTVKEFIQKNADRTIQTSEKFLLRSLKPETVRDAADKIWRDFAARPVSEARAFLPAEKLPRYGEALALFWSELRRQPLFEAVVRATTRRFYALRGEESVLDLLATAGLDRERFIEEGERALQPLFVAARDSGLLEARIRERLETFYRSADAARILDA